MKNALDKNVIVSSLLYHWEGNIMQMILLCNEVLWYSLNRSWIVAWSRYFMRVKPRIFVGTFAASFVRPWIRRTKDRAAPRDLWDSRNGDSYKNNSRDRAKYGPFVCPRQIRAPCKYWPYSCNVRLFRLTFYSCPRTTSKIVHADQPLVSDVRGITI